MAKRKSSRGRRPEEHSSGPALPRARADSGRVWLYGAHPVLEALGNPRRHCHRLLLGEEAAHRHGARLRAAHAARRAAGGSPAPTPEPAPRNALARLLPEGAVHQGLALLADPLPQPDLAEVLARTVTGRECAGRGVIVALDQVSDPHNVGAILRSAAAFGAAAAIAPKRHAAAESGALAKSASGALEHVPYVQVTNLARSLSALKEAGFWCVGLAGEAERTLAEADPGGPVALVLGAEGSGLRRLTREACDVLVRLPTRPPITALNVSNAAAVALYQLLART